MKSFLKANYHTHTYRCQHAYGTEQEYIERAIEMGLEELGFSDHIPCPYENNYVSRIRMTMKQAEEYVSYMRRMQEAYQDRIRIYVGFEAEYIPEFFSKQMDLLRQLDCDYLIMGQHFLESEDKGPYMGTSTKDESRIREYVDSIVEGMETGRFSYLAHPDLIHYQGMDSVYEWEMFRLCKEMKRLAIPLELNMLGVMEGRHYPDERFWRIAGEIGNQVILGIDAHSPRHFLDLSSYEHCMNLVEKYQLNLIQELKFIR